jgi:hypothetical protein
MVLSNLQKLVRELTRPLQDNPDALIESMIPKDKRMLYQAAKGILPKFGIHPGTAIAGLVDKLNKIPTDVWYQIEDALIGVIEGNPEDIQKVKELLGVKS